VAADQPLDLLDVAKALDVDPDEVRRQVGAVTAVSPSRVSQQRLAALLERPGPDDDTIGDVDPDDPARAGALIARLGDAATATVIATWMAWTPTRTTAVLAELDRRLMAAGLRLHADRDGHLRIGSRLRLRRRPAALAFELLTRLDHPRYRHALTHLLRGDDCCRDERQLLVELGVVADPCSRRPQPHPALAASFAAAVPRTWSPPQSKVIVVNGDPRHEPTRP
jgi:hypothetical protein